MRKLVSAVVLSVAAWGCSGEDGSPPVEPLPGEQVDPIAVMNLPGERVELYRILVPSEGSEVEMLEDGETIYDWEDTYLMFRSGNTTSSLYDRLYNLEGEPVTFAEMYLHAKSGKVTSDILQSHFSQATRMGRSQEFLDVLERPEKETGAAARLVAFEEEGLTEKLSWNDDDDFTPPIPFHHWENVHITNKSWGCFQNPNPAGYGCGSAWNPPSTFAMYACNNHALDSSDWNGDFGIKSGTPTSNSCVKGKGWTRVAMAHPSQNAQATGVFAQLYFGPSSLGAWTTFAPGSVPEGTWAYSDWDSGSSLVSMAMASFRGYPWQGGNNAVAVARFMNGQVVDN
jgi:hypothetical protein